MGGATGIPSWGKFWLSVLNVYDWSGNESIPPELWILPDLLPFHPSKMWCHTRAVYLPMCYLYGIRYCAPLDDLTTSLRNELYVTPYEDIVWVKQKAHVSPVDVYYETTQIMNFLNGVLAFYETMPNQYVRDIALKEALRQIRMEDTNTEYLDIGPVNKVMHMLVIWIVDGPESGTFAKHVSRIPDFMWVSKEGMMMNGTNGSQVWDTAFAVQAVMAGDLQKDGQFKSFLDNSLRFLDHSQVFYYLSFRSVKKW